MSQAAARQLRDQPYRRDHETALVERMQDGIRPATLKALLGWYERAWSDESVDRLHGQGVWRSEGTIVRGTLVNDSPHARSLEVVRDSGGSHIGSPAMTDPFRRWLENDPRQTDTDGCYLTPMRAALRHMAEDKPARPLTARFLFRVAQAGFDVVVAADGAGMPIEYALLLAKGGLDLLWTAYLARPPISSRPSVSVEEMAVA